MSAKWSSSGRFISPRLCPDRLPFPPSHTSCMLPTLLVALVSFVAAAINAVAGGGTFLTFPSLTGFLGLTDTAANMVSTIGLWPGSAASVVAAREDFQSAPPIAASLRYILISMVGGILGAILLRVTTNASFKLVIPWLLLLATVIFAFGKRIARWAGRHHGTPSIALDGSASPCCSSPSAVYGGYFGAGIGVLMLAGLAFVGLEDLNQMNALKVLLSTIINGVASVIFAFQLERKDLGTVGLMAVCSIVGGFLGMAVARRVKQSYFARSSSRRGSR